MNKNDLAEIVSGEINITTVQGKEIIDIILKEIQTVLMHGKKNVQLRGLGSFVVQMRQPMRRKHPVTRKMITIPAKKIVKFIPGKDLKKL